MRRNNIILLSLSIVLIISIITTIGLGAVSIHPLELIGILLKKIGCNSDIQFTSQQENVAWIIRIPRILMSVMLGAALATSGTAMQGLFRNPLADPSIIGVSSGAALAAAISIVVLNNSMVDSISFIGVSALSMLTFLGAIVSTILIFRFSKNKGVTLITTMLLAGIAINALAGASTGLLTYMATDSQLRSMTFWTLGSLGGANWTNVSIVTLSTLTTIFILRSFHKSFNALSLGEKEAEYLGTDVEKLKKTVIICTSLAIGTSVAFCGIIGFIGLVIPHIIRLLGGSNHKFLIPASALGGAILLNWTDSIARTIVAPAEIPVGVITALIGAPIFLILLKTKIK